LTKSTELLQGTLDLLILKPISLATGVVLKAVPEDV
jgi:hypothetical protein